MSEEEKKNGMKLAETDERKKLSKKELNKLAKQQKKAEKKLEVIFNIY